MQNVTSNLVYVVVLGQDPLRCSSLTVKDTGVYPGAGTTSGNCKT